MLDNNKNILQHFQLLLAVFAVVILTTGVAAYFFAATQLKNQLGLKCQALAATVAAVIAEDMESDYYRRTKTLMVQIKSVNQLHVEYIYTTQRVSLNAV